jgi:hypothetical protein
MSVDPMTQLFFSSWETIVRRSFLIAQGRCSSAEYQRMLAEKMQAAILTAAWMAMHPGRISHSMLTPWRRRAAANAKRLRKQGPV